MNESRHLATISLPFIIQEPDDIIEQTEEDPNFKSITDRMHEEAFLPYLLKEEKQEVKKPKKRKHKIKRQKLLPRVLIGSLISTIFPLIIVYLAYGNLRITQEEIDLLESVEYLVMTPPLSGVSLTNKTQNSPIYKFPRASGEKWYEYWFASVQNPKNNEIGFCDTQTPLDSNGMKALRTISSSDLWFWPYAEIELEYFKEEDFRAKSEGANCPSGFPKICGKFLCVKNKVSCPIESFRIEKQLDLDYPQIKLNETAFLTWTLMTSKSGAAFPINLTMTTKTPSICLGEATAHLERDYPCYWEPSDSECSKSDSSHFFEIEKFSFGDVAAMCSDSEVSKVIKELRLSQNEKVIFLSEVRSIPLCSWNASHFQETLNKSTDVAFAKEEVYFIIQYLKFGANLMILMFFEFNNHPASSLVSAALALFSLFETIELFFMMGRDFQSASWLKQLSKQTEDSLYKKAMGSIASKIFICEFVEVIFPFIQFLLYILITFHLGFSRNKKRTGMF